MQRLADKLVFFFVVVVVAGAGPRSVDSTKSVNSRVFIDVKCVQLVTGRTAGCAAYWPYWVILIQSDRTK